MENTNKDNVNKEVDKLTTRDSLVVSCETSFISEEEDNKPPKTGEKLVNSWFKKAYDPRRNLEGRGRGVENFKTIFERALKRVADVNGKDPDELYEEIVSNGILSARKGDYRFYKDLFDRLYGKPKESIDHTSAGEKINNSPVEWVIRDYRKKDNGEPSTAN